jgi:hypothetical protein
MEDCMKTRPMILALTFAVVVLFGVAASAQPQPPVGKLPPGFKVETQSAGPGSVVMAAVKPNSAKAKLALDPDIHLVFTWQPNPAAAQIIDILAVAPEEPASGQGGVKTEPAGRTRLRGGVLTYTRRTTLQIGTSAPPWVVYDGAWVAALDDGLLSIGVSNYAGAKEEILPLIEALIPPGMPKQ